MQIQQMSISLVPRLVERDNESGYKATWGGKGGGEGGRGGGGGGHTITMTECSTHCV